ncbi:MAG: ATP-binding cassette domain-containing protein [Puniceicoccales bacterium]|jgi:ABC-2 type transport system ATP-binding protein|nr:ATP-binding cassette domain-containing protein [Puniceicoccales bacterium]
MPAVILENVRKVFTKPDCTALESLTASIREGMITGLVGPDGAGKTTLLRLIAGLLSPTEGTVTVLGKNPVKAAKDLRDALGYMPQKFGLYEDLSVQENLELYADLRNVIGAERRKTFARLLDFTNLHRFTDRMAGKLSGGMKQKLGLACTLLGKPKLLLLDEPGVGVDPISRRELWSMVRNLAGEGMSIIWSTAYLDEAEQCDEVLLLNEGRLLFAGVPSALTSRVGERCFQVRGFLGRPRAALAKVIKMPGVMDGSVQGYHVRVLMDNPARAKAVSSVLGESVSLVPVAPRFEDAFIDCLGGMKTYESALAVHMKKREQDGAVVIEARHLTKMFGTFKATDDVTFTVKRGEIFGLLGPNGAGKSTTFKMMCGLLKVSSGDALVMGLDLKHSASAARQKLGYMAQKFSLYENLTVWQNMEFFSGVYGLGRSEQREAMNAMEAIFHLQSLRNVEAGTLPLGFKQRLALACAVMHEPDILFLDEPTSGVDPVTRREFWTHINGVVEKGITVMVTTHFMDEAEYCDRIGLVSNGKLVAVGTPDELKQQAMSEQNPEPSMEDAFIALVSRKEI